MFYLIVANIYTIFCRFLSLTIFGFVRIITWSKVFSPFKDIKSFFVSFKIQKQRLPLWFKDGSSNNS